MPAAIECIYIGQLCMHNAEHCKSFLLNSDYIHVYSQKTPGCPEMLRVDVA